MAKKKKKSTAAVGAAVENGNQQPQPKDNKSHAPAARWQRGCEAEVIQLDPESPIRVQRVCDAVRGLEAKGKITMAHVVAAQRWIADYERGHRSPAPDPATAWIRGNSVGPEAHLAGGVDAATRVYEVRQTLGGARASNAGRSAPSGAVAAGVGAAMGYSGAMRPGAQPDRGRSGGRARSAGGAPG